MKATEQSEKKIFKKQMNHMAGGIILYTILSFGIILLDMFVKAMLTIIHTANEAEQDRLLDELIAQLEKSGTSSAIAAVVGVLALSFYFRRTVIPKELFVKNNSMKLGVFGQLLCVFTGIQLVAWGTGELMEKAFHLFGYSSMSSMEAASADSETISMFLYVSIVGPITEELVYRGFVLRTLQRYGKIFAILVSSILFAFMHANLPQAVLAFMTGLVLGYAAMEYSILWSMLLHILNNGVFGELLSEAISGFSPKIQEQLYMYMMTVCFVLGVIVLWKKRKEMKEYIKKYRTKKRKYVYAFTSIGIVLFIVVELLAAVNDMVRQTV